MTRLFWQTLKVAPVVFAASLFAANGASAQEVSSEGAGVNQTLEQINNYRQMGQNNSQSQVTNVNQLRDVSPTDWAYEALRSLVDRYGCIAGFPNQTYRGNQALTRYEFAAGLNSCLNQIERLIASQGSVGQEDLDTVNRLVQEFEAELATVGGRVDELESRAAVLEDNQFSTTTKLKGEVIFAVVDTFGDVDGADDPTETTFSDRVRLNFDSSFTGKDRLRTRLEAGNVPVFDEPVGEGGIGIDAARLGFDASNDNDVEINDLYYRTRLFDDRVTLYAGTEGLDINNIFDVQNPVLASSGTGALSRFTRRNPILFRGGSEGSGVGASFNLFNDKITVTGLYMTEDGGGDDGSGSPEEAEGIFNGSFNTGAQIEFEPIDNLALSVVYLRTFQTEEDVDLTGDTGTDLAEEPFGDVDTSADQVGLTASYDIGKFNFAINGAVSFADAQTDSDDSALIYTASGSVSYLDLIKEGSSLSVAGGVVPTVVENDNVIGEDDDTPFIVEALYKFPVNDNILITPGAFLLVNPDGDSDNDEVFVTVLRTTFQF
ncbi:MAG: iron uptake porin [Cyanobacteria bacterium P01_G01_bin.39]